MYSHKSGISFAVYAYAASALARGGASDGPEGTMTIEDAERMVKALLDAHGVGGDANVFGRKGVAGVMLGAAELFFEYDSANRKLACGALVYRFRGEPRPGVLEGFFDEEAGADAGGGALDYRAEARALFLSRTYSEPVPGDEFAGDMKRLAEASLQWGDEVLERVSSRVLPSGETNAGRAD